MIRIEQMKIPHPEGRESFMEKIEKTLGVKKAEVLSYEIRKHSIDARKKPCLFHIYTVDVEVREEARILRKLLKKGKGGHISYVEQKEVDAYCAVPCGEEALTGRPAIIGTGPAGLFCGYELARMGYRPILLERGMDVDSRIKDVKDFWEGGALKAESNVQFGEGGAGTFSDGKLNTLTKDRGGRNREVLRLFAAHGAPREILYESKPHIGTDILADVVKNIRGSIQQMGGEVRFHTKVTDILTFTEGGVERLTGLIVLDTVSGKESVLPASVAVFAIGHSARDTFSMLEKRHVHMEAKSFAVGVRVEHPQALIDRAQYGREARDGLPAAAYKLAANLESGRGVYTFCMCPGGYVVNASSEEGRIAVNGMSYSARDGRNANSAVIVTVTPEDYKAFGDGPLAGICFQRRLEEAACLEGEGSVPAQRFADFQKGVPSSGGGNVSPQIKGSYTWGNVRRIFPGALAEALEEGILEFDKKIPGYASKDTVVTGVESRTSSPVRIRRDENMESSIKGLYPCGEGAGYAGGITSSAADGLKVAETVSRKYCPFDKEGLS